MTKGVWRCSGCGEAYDHQANWKDWRWASDHYEHKCAGMDPQAGHYGARWFGDGRPMTPEDYRYSWFTGGVNVELIHEMHRITEGQCGKCGKQREEHHAWEPRRRSQGGR